MELPKVNILFLVVQNSVKSFETLRKIVDAKACFSQLLGLDLCFPFQDCFFVPVFIVLNLTETKQLPSTLCRAVECKSDFFQLFAHFPLKPIAAFFANLPQIGWCHVFIAVATSCHLYELIYFPERERLPRKDTKAQICVIQ